MFDGRYADTNALQVEGQSTQVICQRTPLNTN